MTEQNKYLVKAADIVQRYAEGSRELGNTANAEYAEDVTGLQRKGFEKSLKKYKKKKVDSPTRDAARAGSIGAAGGVVGMVSARGKNIADAASGRKITPGKATRRVLGRGALGAGLGAATGALFNRADNKAIEDAHKALDASRKKQERENQGRGEDTE